MCELAKICKYKYTKCFLYQANIAGNIFIVFTSIRKNLYEIVDTNFFISVKLFYYKLPYVYLMFHKMPRS